MIFPQIHFAFLDKGFDLLLVACEGCRFVYVLLSQRRVFLLSGKLVLWEESRGIDLGSWGLSWWEGFRVCEW